MRKREFHQPSKDCRHLRILLVVVLSATLCGVAIPVFPDEWFEGRSRFYEPGNFAPIVEWTVGPYLEYRFDPRANKEIPVTGSSLNQCGEWKRLAHIAVRKVIREEIQSSKPYFQVQCFQHRNGDRSFVVDQKNSAFFGYRSPAGGGDTLDKFFSADFVDPHSSDDLSLVVVDDRVVGILIGTRSVDNQTVQLQFISVDGWRSDRRIAKKLFILRSDGNQQFLAFEAEYSDQGDRGWATTTRYSAEPEVLSRTEVDAARNKDGILNIGGPNIFSAMDSYREHLHFYWERSWTLAPWGIRGAWGGHMPRNSFLNGVPYRADSDGPRRIVPPPPSRQATPSGECPKYLPIPPEMELDYGEVGGPVICNVKIGPKGWWQEEQDSEYSSPRHSLQISVVRGDFAETAKVAYITLSDQARDQIEKMKAGAVSDESFDDSVPSPESARHWCVSGRMSSNCGTEFVSGENWIGLMGETAFGVHRKVGGYAGLFEACRAAIIGPNGLGIAIDGMGGCNSIERFLESLVFGDDTDPAAATDIPEETTQGM